jgi:sporulation protein YlmC with PRC-barrel domain
MSANHADLRPGTDVYASDGQRVGTLESVLVDQEAMELRHIVVKESPRVSGHHWYQGANALIHDVIIPAKAVRLADEQRIDLNLSISDVRHMPPFLSYQYVGATTAAQMLGGMAGGLVWTWQEQADEPRGEIEVRKGESVMFKDSGELLGHVHELVYDGHELVAVVVRPRGLLTHDVLLQVRFLDRSDDEALFAHITEADLKHLTA